MKNKYGKELKQINPLAKNLTKEERFAIIKRRDKNERARAERKRRSKHNKMESRRNFNR